MAFSYLTREAVAFIDRRDVNYSTLYDRNVTMEMCWDRFISSHNGFFKSFLAELEANKRFDIIVRFEHSHLIHLVKFGYDIDVIARLAMES